ncbi:MAG TPA: hypothetical protein VF659_03365 [Pyrinomonadaceae bacterium]|jgi:hypothetical protein
MNDAAAREQEDTETEAPGHGLRVPFSGEARARLARLVAVKLALDLLFVGAFALYTHAVTYRAGFAGELEHADGRGARGWVADLERPGEPVEVQLFENGRFVASTVADELRPDAEAGAAPGGRGRRGFTFTFGRDLYGEHEIRVYAVRAGRGGARRTLQQIGRPVGVIWK